MVAGVVSIRNI